MRPSRSLPTAGFSLVEMLIVVVIIGMTTLFAFPRAQRMFEHTNVRGARSTIVNLLNAAKIAARQSNTQSSFILTNNFVQVVRTLDGVTETVMQRDLANAYDVAITSGNLTLDFDPRGVVKGGGTSTIVVSKSGFADSVVVDRYGRIRR